MHCRRIQTIRGGNGGRLGFALIMTLFVSFVGSVRQDKAHQRCGEYTTFPSGKTVSVIVRTALTPRLH